MAPALLTVQRAPQSFIVHVGWGQLGCPHSHCSPPSPQPSHREPPALGSPQPQRFRGSPEGLRSGQGSPGGVGAASGAPRSPCSHPETPAFARPPLLSGVQTHLGGGAEAAVPGSAPPDLCAWVGPVTSTAQGGTHRARPPFHLLHPQPHNGCWALVGDAGPGGRRRDTGPAIAPPPGSQPGFLHAAPTWLELARLWDPASSTRRPQTPRDSAEVGPPWAGPGHLCPSDAQRDLPPLRPLHSAPDSRWKGRVLPLTLLT